MDNNELSHHGVKGMKWGVIRSKYELLKARGEKKKADAEEAAKSKKKKIQNMSDTELREKITRLELEKRYTDLTTSANQAKGAKGKAFTMRVLEKSGENLSVQVANHIGAKVINKIIGEEVVFANNKKK